jgi:anti-anti-sigma regulatory factor
MMKAQVRESGDQVTLQVCGRLAAECWVGELEKCWQAARAKYHGQRIVVDLRGVTFIDQTGERLLESMHRDGATFLTAGLLVQEMVSQITGGAK